MRLWRGKRKCFSHLYDVVVEQQPEAVALHDRDVVSAVWTAAERRKRRREEEEERGTS